MSHNNKKEQHDFYQQHIHEIPVPQYLQVEKIFNKMYYDFILSIYDSQELSIEELSTQKISSEYYFQYPYDLPQFELIQFENIQEYDLKSIFKSDDFGEITPIDDVVKLLVEKTDLKTNELYKNIDTQNFLNYLVKLENFNDKFEAFFKYIENLNEKNLEKLDQNYSIIALILCQLKSSGISDFDD